MCSVRTLRFVVSRYSLSLPSCMTAILAPVRLADSRDLALALERVVSKAEVEVGEAD